MMWIKAGIFDSFLGENSTFTQSKSVRAVLKIF